MKQEVIDLNKDYNAAVIAGDTAADNYAWQVNNILEWYSMYFSPEVIDQQNDMFWGKDNQGYPQAGGYAEVTDAKFKTIYELNICEKRDRCTVSLFMDSAKPAESFNM